MAIICSVLCFAVADENFCSQCVKNVSPDSNLCIYCGAEVDFLGQNVAVCPSNENAIEKIPEDGGQTHTWVPIFDSNGFTVSTSGRVALNDRQDTLFSGEDTLELKVKNGTGKMLDYYIKVYVDGVRIPSEIWGMRLQPGEERIGSLGFCSKILSFGDYLETDEIEMVLVLIDPEKRKDDPDRTIYISAPVKYSVQGFSKSIEENKTGYLCSETIVDNDFAKVRICGSYISEKEITFILETENRCGFELSLTNLNFMFNGKKLTAYSVDNCIEKGGRAFSRL